MKKTHKRWLSDGGHRTWCSLLIRQIGLAQAKARWADVTCLNCLKQRPRRR